MELNTSKNLNYEREISYNNVVLTICLLTIIFFLNFSGSDDYYLPIFIVTPKIKYFIIAMLLIFFGVFARENKYRIKFDIILIFLLIQFIYYFFRLLLSGTTDYSLSLLSYFYPFISYFWGFNNKPSKGTLLTITNAFLWILSSFTLITIFFVSKLNLPLYLFKSNILIPIGASNAITTYVILMLPISYYLDKNHFRKFFTLFLSIILILFSRSNSGILVSSTMLLYFILKEKNNRFFKFLFILISLLLIIFISAQFIPGYFDRFLDAINSITGNGFNLKDDVLNGRTSVYEVAKEIISNNYLFGTGFSYRNLMPNKLMTHNWILESLITGGGIALIIRMFILSMIIIKNNKFMNLDIRNTIKGMLIFTLIQGLVEPSFGSPYFELIFWLLIGLLIPLGNYRSNRKTISFE